MSLQTLYRGGMTDGYPVPCRMRTREQPVGRESRMRPIPALSWAGAHPFSQSPYLDAHASVSLSRMRNKENKEFPK